MRILLINDDPASPHSLVRTLRSKTCTIHSTCVWEEGIDLAKLYDFDIILLDLNRPDLSDYEVLRSLRLAKVKTPILILSGSVVATSKGQAQEFHQAA
jgi:two-component system, cell cycle response regulator CtrA